MNIEEPGGATAFEMMGGEAPIERMVTRFYDLMDLQPEYAALRAVHGPDLESASEKLFWFLCGWMGGPQHYIERFGHPRLRMRHMPFKIGVRERNQWLACMTQAMQETGVPEALCAQLQSSFFQTADWMVNQQPPIRKL